MVRTGGFHPPNRGSIPLRSVNAVVAQLVERRICNSVVGDSNSSYGSFFNMCHRQSWRVENDCKSFAFGLSRFESYVTHHI